MVQLVYIASHRRPNNERYIHHIFEQLSHQMIRYIFSIEERQAQSNLLFKIWSHALTPSVEPPKYRSLRKATSRIKEIVSV